MTRRTISKQLLESIGSRRGFTGTKHQKIAAAHGKNVGQVILRWDLQHQILPIPKSAHLARQRTNLDVFDFTLTNEEMAAIDSLTKPDGRLKDQDPAVYQEFNAAKEPWCKHLAAVPRLF